MRSSKKLLLVTLAGLAMCSCEEEKQELIKTSTKDDLIIGEKAQVIDYKGLKVNHRFSTPIEDLELNLDEVGNKVMYSHIKKGKSLNGSNSLNSSLELPNEDIIIEATKEVVDKFPYDYENEPIFERHEIHKLLDTLPVEVQITLLQNEPFISILKQESKDFEIHQEKVKEFQKAQDKRKLDMLHHDFEGLSDEQIANNIEIIDEYYKKNMNY